MTWPFGLAALTALTLANATELARPAVVDPSSGTTITLIEARACAKDATGIVVSTSGAAVERKDGSTTPISRAGGAIACGTAPVASPAPALTALPASTDVTLRAVGGTVEAIGRDGRARWRIDVVAKCPVAVGEPKIRVMSLPASGRVRLVLGKHTFSSIDPATGDVRCQGAD